MFLFSIAHHGVLWPRHFYLPGIAGNDNHSGSPFHVVREDKDDDEDEVPSGLITLY